VTVPPAVPPVVISTLFMYLQYLQFVTTWPFSFSVLSGVYRWCIVLGCFLVRWTVRARFTLTASSPHHGVPCTAHIILPTTPSLPAFTRLPRTRINLRTHSHHLLYHGHFACLSYRTWFRTFGVLPAHSPFVVYRIALRSAFYSRVAKRRKRFWCHTRHHACEESVRVWSFAATSIRFSRFIATAHLRLWREHCRVPFRDRLTFTQSATRIAACTRGRAGFATVRTRRITSLFFTSRIFACRWWATVAPRAHFAPRAFMGSHACHCMPTCPHSTSHYTHACLAPHMPVSFPALPCTPIPVRDGLPAFSRTSAVRCTRHYSRMVCCFSRRRAPAQPRILVRRGGSAVCTRAVPLNRNATRYTPHCFSPRYTHASPPLFAPRAT